jgi:hypothetical protein
MPSLIVDAMHPDRLSWEFPPPSNCPVIIVMLARGNLSNAGGDRRMRSKMQRAVEPLGTRCHHNS